MGLKRGNDSKFLKFGVDIGGVDIDGGGGGNTFLSIINGPSIYN